MILMFIRMMLLTFVLAAVGACSSGPSSSAEEVIAVGGAPIAWLVERIAPEGVEVQVVGSGGGDPHAAELSARDLTTLSRARLVVRIAEGLQPSLDRALESESVASFTLSDHVSAFNGDPHLWLAPALLAEATQELSARLSQTYVEQAQAVADSSKQLVGELRSVDSAFDISLASCRRDVIVTTHDAFGYWESEYGLTVESAVGLAPGAEPTVERIEQLRDLVDRLEIPVVFGEAGSTRIAATIAKDQASVEELDTLETLTEETYRERMLANIELVKDALGCD